MPADPVIAILAAGASRRMRGADKLLEPVDGAPVLRRVAEAALGTGLDVLVTLPPGHPARRRALEGLAVGVVEVPDAGTGMAASFRALARHVPPGTPVLTLLGDMPEIRTEDIAAVARAFGDAAGDRVVRAASEDGMPGQPVAFPARLVPAFAELTGDTGARGLLDAEDVRLVPCPGARATTDLDTPEDWARWRARRTDQI